MTNWPPLYALIMRFRVPANPGAVLSWVAGPLLVVIPLIVRPGICISFAAVYSFHLDIAVVSGAWFGAVAVVGRVEAAVRGCCGVLVRGWHLQIGMLTIGNIFRN